MTFLYRKSLTFIIAKLKKVHPSVACFSLWVLIYIYIYIYIYANKEVTTNTLLNGSNDLNMNENLHVFKIAEKFIEMINLF